MMTGKRRHYADRILETVFWGAGLLILLLLAGIIGYLFYRGGGVLSWEFVTAQPQGFPVGTAGGIFPAIKGTVYLVLLATVFAAAPGIITAVYLAEYGGSGRLSSAFSLVVQCMAGIPSIVTGLFAYAVLVVWAGFGISLIAGCFALAIMVFPVIVITTRDALASVNPQYRLIGASMGVSRWYLLRRVILPQAAPAVFGGLLLAMGYAAGATAPIMVTAAVIAAPSSGNLLEPVMALPYHLYVLFSQRISVEMAYGTALLLVLMLLGLNAVAMWLRNLKRDGA